MKLGALGCLTIAATLLAAGGAFGTAQTIKASDNVFGAATYTMDQGDRPTLQNAGVNQHNATASSNGPDREPLFSTPTIGPGTANLNGTQYLTTGNYTFICTIHPSTMIATLSVSANGTPVPRPTMTLKLLSRSIAKVLKNGLLVQIDSTAKSEEISVEAKLGKATIARTLDVSEAQGRTFIKMKLTKVGKRKLADLDKATIRLKGTIAFGAPTSARGKLK